MVCDDIDTDLSDRVVTVTRRRRIGHDASHFNVGTYRRRLNMDDEGMQDAEFFDHNNKVLCFSPDVHGDVKALYADRHGDEAKGTGNGIGCLDGES